MTEGIVWATVALCAALIIHLASALQRGFDQQMALLNAINDDDPHVALKKLYAYALVSFEAHLWRVTTFRDPWVLYPAELADEIKLVRGSV